MLWNKDKKLCIILFIPTTRFKIHSGFFSSNCVLKKWLAYQSYQNSKNNIKMCDIILNNIIFQKNIFHKSHFNSTFHVRYCSAFFGSRNSRDSQEIGSDGQLWENLLHHFFILFIIIFNSTLLNRRCIWRCLQSKQVPLFKWRRIRWKMKLTQNCHRVFEIRRHFQQIMFH